MTTVGIALRANPGSTVTQQLAWNVLSVVEQLQAYAQVYFPGTGSPVQQQQEQLQHGVERHFIGSEAGNEVGENSSKGVHHDRSMSEILPKVRDDMELELMSGTVSGESHSWGGVYR